MNAVFIMRTLFLLLLMPLLRACAPLADVQPPQVELVNVRPGSFAVYQSQGEVALQLVNNNDQPITVTGATYEVIIDATHVGRAIARDPIEIPPHVAAAQRATLYIRNQVMFDRLKTILQQPRIHYTIRGSLELTTAAGASGTISTQDAGQLTATTE